ncbi:hypothetical protein BELL_0240g00060 [Botrytis elliptica]|uniref:Fungal N-terminal domain-containing protein n=1 Tax=Botrytis elliptica TaxID=278938 RepID=A0A4Z1K0W4_9HELO|nr:hypothetical protein EAE99_006529 [Botrytis elliptica]TGO75013.1 hypothetical protein BELL_0240g00060 [Botrytis elliptica]
MALEVIGGIASILQLAGTVYTISKTLYEVGEALSNAPSDIKDLARDLETFSDELHLLSTLLHGKDGRYADQVYRLTAKIIGDCATICTKIDRIIRKLRSGSVLAKIKWLYKEKEIMKLLARLRDLKLSLMGTLSVLSALRADNMMDSLGINNPSLIGGPNGHGLSTETRMQVEDTRLKLAGMSMKDTTEVSSGSKPTLPSSASLVSGGSSPTLSTSVTSATYVGPSTARIPSTTDFSASSFISMAVVPKSMPPILNTQANQSVDSFHSALSHQNQDSLDGRMKQVESFPEPEDSNYVPVIPQSVMVSDVHDKASFSVEESRQLDTSVSKTLKSWRNEMTISAMRHFNMNVKDAEEWANNLPIPSNLSAITEPTGPAEILSHPRVEDKPQEIGRARLKAGCKEDPSPSDANHQSPIFTPPEAFRYISSGQHSPVFLDHSSIESDNPKSRNHQTDTVLGSPMGGETHFSGFCHDGPRTEEVDGYDASPAYSPASPVYYSIEADRSPIQADKTLLSLTGGKKCPNNSNFMDESAVVRDWLLTDEKKMTSSPPKSAVLKSNEVIEHHGYNTNFTEQAISSSQDQSDFGPVNLDMPSAKIRHIATQPKNQDLSKRLPQKLGLTSQEMQLRLLEDQNNRRLEMAKREQQNSYQQLLDKSHQANLRSALPKLDIPANELVYQDYQRRILLIEKDHKNRLTMTQQKQQIRNSVLPSTSVTPNCQSETSIVNDNFFGGNRSAELNHFPYSTSNLFGIPAQLRPVGLTFAQSEHVSQLNSPSCPTPSVVTQINQNFTAAQARASHETSQQHQKPQSSTQQAQPIQMQHQQLQKHQQQQQMAPLSPPRRLGVTERVTGVDFGRWHNVDACQSMEISAAIPLGLYELGTEDLLPKREPKEIHLQSQVSQETCKRDGQPSYPSISPFGKSDRRGRMELPPDYPNDISRQAFNSPKSDKSNNISAFHFHNEVSNKGPGGLWVRGFINVKSFDAVIWSNLKQYLNRERVYTTSEAGSVPLVANLDWSATLYKERIALLRQMFPRAASSIQKILDVLAVMEETIGLTIGAIAWACLLGAVENLLSHSTNWTVDYQIRIITEMSEIVSIIARYTVMENIYAQWKGMTLDKDYEQSLINLSTRVLVYLGAFVPSFSESSTNANTKPYFEKIIEADTACRGFTVIVSSKSTAIDRKRSFEESSVDSDDTVDSDGTILEVDGNDEVDDMPSSAKRIKI